jgi:PIN domain nuclease of toxin-antitoxin system
MYLLDTNILIWLLEGNRAKVGKKLYDMIANSEKIIYVSVVSYWEIVIKSELGKLEVPDDLPAQVKAAGFHWLSVDLEPIMELKKLPHLHEDPFDRLLIAQAQAANLTFITADQLIPQYAIQCLQP